MTERIEPKIHSHIEDGLPDDHPLAWEQVDCMTCGKPVHNSRNECISSWVETGKGIFCFRCWINALGAEGEGGLGVLKYYWGLNVAADYWGLKAGVHK